MQTTLPSCPRYIALDLQTNHLAHHDGSLHNFHELVSVLHSLSLAIRSFSVDLHEIPMYINTITLHMFATL